MQRLKACLEGLSWSRVLFGDEPWPMLFLLLACGMVLTVLARDALPAILAVVILALAAHAWVWCQSQRAEADAESEARRSEA